MKMFNTLTFHTPLYTGHTYHRFVVQPCCMHQLDTGLQLLLVGTHPAIDTLALERVRERGGWR